MSAGSEFRTVGAATRKLRAPKLSFMFFRLDALALSIIATATWLGDWVSVTAGIVSKRLNLSENFLDHLVPHHLSI